MRKIFLMTLIVLFAAAAAAHARPFGKGDFNLPHGKWWQNKQVITQLKLTEEEQAKLNELFVGSQRRMFDLKSNVDKERFEVEQQLEQAEINEAAIKDHYNNLTQAQNILSAERFTFLLEVRKLLGLERYQVLKTKFQQRRQNMMRQRLQQKGAPNGSGKQGLGKKKQIPTE
jgi:Spy/CpxP family protein refolding chaperone